MKRARRVSLSKSSRGAAVVEMALVLPLLLVIFFGVFEAWRGIRTNNAIVHIGREGANLASRSSINNLQDIMDVVAGTASAVKMEGNGTLYITKMEGLDTKSRVKVVAQALWLGSTIDGDVRSKSRLYACGEGYVSGDCNISDPDTEIDSPLNMGPGEGLKEGETVYGVEVFYKYESVFKYVIPDDILLYTATVL